MLELRFAVVFPVLRWCGGIEVDIRLTDQKVPSSSMGFTSRRCVLGKGSLPDFFTAIGCKISRYPPIMDGQEKILSVCWSEAPVNLLLLCNAPLEVERGKLVNYVLSGNFCKAP